MRVSFFGSCGFFSASGGFFSSGEESLGGGMAAYAEDEEGAVVVEEGGAAEGVVSWGYICEKEFFSSLLFPSPLFLDVFGFIFSSLLLFASHLRSTSS